MRYAEESEDVQTASDDVVLCLSCKNTKGAPVSSRLHTCTS